MSFKTLKWALSLEGLGGKEKLVLIYLADYRNDEKGYAWPSVKTISKKTGYSVSSVKRALKSLCEQGHVVPRQQHHAADGRRFTNRYYFPVFSPAPGKRSFSVGGGFGQDGVWDESNTERHY